MTDLQPVAAPASRRLAAMLLAAFLGAGAGGAASSLWLDRARASTAPSPDRPPADECALGAERLAEIDTLLADAAAPTLAVWEASRLLSAAGGTLSALEARLHRHGACRSAEIADARGRIIKARTGAREAALAPVHEALARHEEVVAALPAAAALADLASARVALSRARSEGGYADSEEELSVLQRRLEDAYANWSREQQRRYDLWALDRARALGAWANANLSDIPLRGAGKAEIEARMVELLGPVEMRQLTPAVQTVHAELFQRLWRELGEVGRIRVVADLVAAPKRMPAEM